jgi:hypothetical protein
MISIKRLTFISNFYAFIFIIIVMAGNSSCKKEYPALPYKDIEQFTIKDAAGTDIKASIDGTSIIVYYPPFQAVPGKVKPVIVVSEGATVSPASGSEVEYKDGTTFEVKAADGSTKTYTLKAWVNQPTPTVEVGDTEIDYGYTIHGEYLLPDTNSTKVFFINAQNKEIQAPAAAFTEFTASRISGPIPVGGDTGSYKVRLISGIYNMVKGPIHIGPPSLMLEIQQTTAKRGAELVIVNPNNSLKYYRSKIAGKASIYYARRDFVEVDVLSITDTEIKLRLPVNYPGNVVRSVVITNNNSSQDIIPTAGTIPVTD